MGKTVLTGLVEKVENIHRNLSFITLSPIANVGWAETKVPVYLLIGPEYEGRVVDITTIRQGFLGKKFEQTIEAANMKHTIGADYSFIKQINEVYRSDYSLIRQIYKLRM